MYSSYHICSTITQQKQEKGSNTSTNLFFPTHHRVSFRTVYILLFVFLFLFFLLQTNLLLSCLFQHLERFRVTHSGTQECPNSPSVGRRRLFGVHIWDVLRFVLQELSRPWSQNIRNAQYSLGYQCLREMHVHCKRTTLQAARIS